MSIQSLKNLLENLAIGAGVVSGITLVVSVEQTYSHNISFSGALKGIIPVMMIGYAAISTIRCAEFLYDKYNVKT